MTQLNIESIAINEDLNPFGATAEELLAGTLDENGLLSMDTKINGQPARSLCDAYYKKRNQFREATRLGDLLVRAGLITPKQLLNALNLQKERAMPLGEVIVSMGFCRQEEIELTLERQKTIREEFERAEEARAQWRSLWKGLVKRLFTP